MDDRGTRRRDRGRPARAAARRLEAGKDGVLLHRPDDHRRDPDRRLLDVPVHHAVVARPAQQPDRVGFDVEPHDAAGDAVRGDRVPADRPALHELGVPRDARQGHASVARREQALDVLNPAGARTRPGPPFRKESDHVVFQLDSRYRRRAVVRHRQRDVARSAAEAAGSAGARTPRLIARGKAARTAPPVRNEPRVTRGFFSSVPSAAPTNPRCQFSARLIPLEYQSKVS
ncbi:hypothetical protein BDI4_560004 [Burkholderia diffusa]|nr:hypothetical protein BDI4_560004 [Burkholderia diffusa]